MLLDKVVVGEMRIETADAIDFFELAWREIFARVEAPAAFKKALAAQNFVNSGNTAGELMCGIKERGVRVGDLLGEREHVWRDGGASFSDVHVADGGPVSFGPVTQEAANDAE